LIRRWVVTVVRDIPRNINKIKLKKMDNIKLLEQMDYSINFILIREKKIVEHKEKLDSFKGKPFYETLIDGIEIIKKEIRAEKELLKLFLKDYEILLNK
jgi:hypothetical protein